MKGIMINVERCIGCRHCEIACSIEHSQSKDAFKMINETPKPASRIFVEVGINFLTFPNRCRHCEPAPCMQVCPTNALQRDEKTDSVLVNYGKCISCTACAIACPFGIIQFKELYGVDRIVNAKCDNCIGRQMSGEIPACVEACKTGALEFGDMNELIRTSRKDFTVRLIKSKGTEVEVPKIPENIKLFRNFLEKIAREGPFKEV